MNEFCVRPTQFKLGAQEHHKVKCAGFLFYITPMVWILAYSSFLFSYHVFSSQKDVVCGIYCYTHASTIKCQRTSFSMVVYM